MLCIEDIADARAVHRRRLVARRRLIVLHALIGALRRDREALRLQRKGLLRLRAAIEAPLSPGGVWRMSARLQKIEDNHRRAVEIEIIVRRDYLNDDCDAADIALGVIEQEPFWTNEQVARHVAQLIEQE